MGDDEERRSAFINKVSEGICEVPLLCLSEDDVLPTTADEQWDKLSEVVHASAWLCSSRLPTRHITQLPMS